MPEKNKEQIEREAQEKYLTLQILDRQIKTVQNQAHDLEQQAGNLEAVRQNLEEFKYVKKGAEILVPLAQGIFAKAELKENKTVIVNSGASITVEKGISDTQTMLETQVQTVLNAQDTVMHQLQRLVHQAQKTEQELRELLK